MKRFPALLAGLSALSVVVTFALGQALPSASAASTSPFTAYITVGDSAGLTALGQRIGTPISYAYDYLDDRSWSNIDDTWDMNNWAGSGYRMIWGVPMLPLSGATLASGATGAYDQYYVTVAKDLVAHGMGNSILRLGWEFNQKSYPWYAAGQASAFVAYWRHIVAAMRGVSGAAFTFEWNPSLGDNGGGDQAMGSFTSYYPGDAYVDLVALDVYDIAWNTYPGEPAQFSSIETRTWGLDWLASFAAQHAKQLAIAEFGLGWGGSAGNGQPYSGTGTVSGGDNPRFVHDMAVWMQQHSAVISGFWDNSFSSIENGQNPLTASEVAADFGGGATVSPSPTSTATVSPSPSPTSTATVSPSPSPTSTTTVSPSPSPTSTTTTTTTTKTTKKHKRSHLRQTGLTLSHVAAVATGIAVSGRLVPAHSGVKVRVETARSSHPIRWASRGGTRTRNDGHFHAVVANSARARYLRVVATLGQHTRHSQPLAIG